MGLILSYDSGGKMNSKDLKRMTRAELLEVLLTQSRRIRELEEELEETKAKLEDREIRIGKVGNLAEAALELSGVFKAADDAAQLYLCNVKRIIRQQAEKQGHKLPSDEELSGKKND